MVKKRKRKMSDKCDMYNEIFILIFEKAINPSKSYIIYRYK